LLISHPLKNFWISACTAPDVLTIIRSGKDDLTAKMVEISPAEKRDIYTQVVDEVCKK